MILPELLEGNAGVAAPRPPLALARISASEPWLKPVKGANNDELPQRWTEQRRRGELDLEAVELNSVAAELDLMMKLDVVSQAMALAWRGWARGRLAPRRHDRQL